MGMDAEVIVIGPCDLLHSCCALDYNDGCYEDVPVGALVLGTVAGADTTNQSEELAAICGVDPWDLGNHQVRRPVGPDDPPYFIGGEFASVIYAKLCQLLAGDRVQIWYRPNG